jgi:adenylate kinase
MIIFMGVAGSGKSLQGKMLADVQGLPWLSTGEFLRMLISGERRKAMVEGKLLTDKEIIELVQKIFTLVDTKQEFVLDGFPRSTGQADWLLNQVKYDQLRVTAIIHLTATEAEVQKRLLERGRPDDYQAAIEERFKEYHDTIMPILEQFKSAGIPIKEVNGEQAVEKVHADIIQALS